MTNNLSKNFLHMKQVELKPKEPYEPPEVVDIKPVTTCRLAGMSDPDENPDEY